MTPPTPLQRLLAAATTPISLLRLFFRRSDSGGDVYPADAASGTVRGDATTLRLVVIGEPGEISLGVLSHEIGNAGFIARRLADRTGRRVDWSIAGVGSSRLRDARAAIVAQVDRLADVHAVVVLMGIIDTLSSTATKKWERHLDDTIAALRLRIPPEAVIAIAEIPPLDNAGSLTRPARAVAGAHGRALNAATRRVVARYDHSVTAPFPAELTRDLWLPRSEEQKYLNTYELWGEAIADTVAAAIGQSR